MAVKDVLNETADLSVYETNMNLLYDKLMELGFVCVKPQERSICFRRHWRRMRGLSA